MAHSIDNLLARIKDLSDAIEQLPSDDPSRERLVYQRAALRQTASELAVQGRHPQSVKREIESIESRLTEIKNLQIKEGYQERRGGRNIQDPGAYSSNINELLIEQHAAEVEALTNQLENLKLHRESEESS